MKNKDIRTGNMMCRADGIEVKACLDVICVCLDGTLMMSACLADMVRH